MPARPPLFDDVALALLREGQAVRFRAAGLSMEPSIRDGDAITVSPVQRGAARVGDVLLYRADGRLLAHRVIGRAEGADGVLLVRADAPGWEVERVAESDVLGRIERIDRNGRGVRLQGAFFRRLAVLSHRLRRRLSETRTFGRSVRSPARLPSPRKR